jgi:MFS family permease
VLLAGFSALARLPGPRTVVLVLGAAAGLWGAIDVLNVALAIDVMHVGSSGAGILGASLGVGGIVGSLLAANLVGRPRMATAFVLGLLVWGVPLIGIAFVPVPLVAVTLLVGAGAGRAVMDVAGRTLLQRASPDEVLSRIFGVLEGIFLGAFGIGSVVIAGLIASLGVQGALILAGLWLPLVALAGQRALRVIDAQVTVPTSRLSLLRAIPMLAPLPGTTLERLARSLQPISLAAGDWVIRQGDSGSRFYVIEAGEVEVSIDNRVVRTEGRGTAFGEIALLRDIPRTASVRALTNVRLLALDREPFLEAVTGNASSLHWAETLVTDRLGN